MKKLLPTNKFSIALTLGLVIFAAPAPIQAQILDVGSQISSFTNFTRGYWFTAPVDFTIEAIRVVEDASSANQDVEILFFNSPAPAFPQTTNDFTSLFRATDVAGGNFISTGDITIFTGDVIGVLGSRGANSTNSNQGGPYLSDILGNSVTLTRLGTQANLRDAPAADLFTESPGPIGRVELQFRAIPEPSSICPLGLFILGLATCRCRV